MFSKPVDRHVRLSLVLVTVLAFSMNASGPALATNQYSGEPEATIRGERAAPWEFVERHQDKHPRFPLELFHPKLVHFYPQIAEAFGTKEPHSSAFLLHAAPGWDKSARPHPVLLIPGSNDDATRRYGFPLSTTHPDHKKRTGLALHLAKQGFSVFAISFSHYHGCNLHQGEHVANAITRIRTLLNRADDRSFSVDLVTYSKGAMAARCYVQSAGQMFGLNYMTPFRNDVRSVVFQVGPIAGLDMPFRYYLYNLTCQSQDIPAPLGVTSQMLYGFWKDAGMNNIHSGYWPGQLQMIHDQRKIGVGYGPLSWTTDANFTMTALRDGGSSFFVRSEGLEAARIAGGDMIERLNERGFPSNVSSVLIAGTHPFLYDENVHTWKIPIGAELSDESDGLVFTKSATYAQGLTASGAKVVDIRKFALNHIDISRADEVYRYVASQLEKK